MTGTNEETSSLIFASLKKTVFLFSTFSSSRVIIVLVEDHHPGNYRSEVNCSSNIKEVVWLSNAKVGRVLWTKRIGGWWAKRSAKRMTYRQWQNSRL